MTQQFNLDEMYVLGEFGGSVADGETSDRPMIWDFHFKTTSGPAEA
jgi:hypothetical protein